MAEWLIQRVLGGLRYAVGGLMKIQSFLIADSSSMYSFINWSSGVNSAISSLGFLQQADTGQVTWPVKQAQIMSCADNGNGTVTYTYRGASGQFAVNQAVVVQGCKTQGFDTAQSIGLMVYPLTPYA